MARNLGQLTVSIGVAMQDFQQKMQEAQKDLGNVAREAKRSGVDLGAGVSAGVATAKSKYLELSTSLRGFAENVQAVSMTVGRYISLPLAGLGTAALASSAEAKRTFDRFASDMRFTFGRLGDQLARDLNLDATLSGISNFAAKAVTAFNSLPKPIRTVIEDFSLFAVAIPVAGTAVAQLSKGLAGVLSLFGRLGPAAVAAGAGVQTAMAAGGTGWAAWGGRAAVAAPAAAAAGPAALSWGLPAVGTAVGSFMAGHAISSMFETERGNIALGLRPETAEQDRQINAMASALARKQFGGGVQVQGPNVSLGLEGIQAQIDQARVTADRLQNAAPFKEIFSGSTPWSQGKTERIQILPEESKAEIERQASEIAALVNNALEGTGTTIQRWEGESAQEFLARMSNSFNGIQGELKTLEDSASQKNIWGPVIAKMDAGLLGVRNTLDLAGDEFARFGDKSSKEFTDAFLEMAQGSELTGDKLEALGQTGEDVLKLMTAAYVKMREDGIEPGNAKLDELKDKILAVQAANKDIKFKVELDEAGKKFQQDLASMEQVSRLQGGGVNLNEGKRQRLIQEYNRQSSQPDWDAQSAGARQLRADIEALQTPTAAFIGQLQSIPPMWQQMGSLMFDTFQMVSKGIGDAVAQAIVYGQDLGQSMVKLMQQVASTIISTLIQIMIQDTIATAVRSGNAATAGAAEVAAASAAGAAWTWASAVKTLGLIGLAVGAALAIGFIASVMASSKKGASAGKEIESDIKGNYKPKSGYDTGGISLTPQMAAVSESGIPELHLTRSNIQRYFPELAGRGGREYVVHNHINMDGREITTQVLRISPQILRERGAI